MTYNGWSNYETWATNLWLTNDEGTYNYLVESAREVADKYELADVIAGIVDDMVNDADLPASLLSDLLSAAVSEINFHEVAEDSFGEFIGKGDA